MEFHEACRDQCQSGGVLHVLRPVGRIEPAPGGPGNPKRATENAGQTYSYTVHKGRYALQLRKMVILARRDHINPGFRLSRWKSVFLCSTEWDNARGRRLPDRRSRLRVGQATRRSRGKCEMGTERQEGLPR